MVKMWEKKTVKMKNQTQHDTIFRCYEKKNSKVGFSYVGSSVFNLIGKKEPDQTKALGFVLARSKSAMEGFLSLIGEPHAKQFLNFECIVDCELMMPNKSSYDRADIVIRFPAKKYAVVIEAKSLNANTSMVRALLQGSGYAQQLSGYTIRVVSLTSNKDLSSNAMLPTSYLTSGSSVSLTWGDVVNLFDRLISKGKARWLEKDFLSYIIKINGIMNYYDVEVYSIPAQRTHKYVDSCGIYECPVKKGRYDKRAQHRPLYMAFRGKNGSVKKLYKVQDLIQMPLAGQRFDTIKKDLEPAVLQQIEQYIKESQYNSTCFDDKWVFVLDLNNVITLPNEVIYLKNNAFTETSRPLAAYFAQPTTVNGKTVVLFT